jgi:hypothetical protein
MATLPTTAKAALLVLLAGAVAATLALRGPRSGGAPPAAPPAPPAAADARPRILELGSTRCQSCQEMARVLDALRASQGARLRVDFIDVFE